MTRTDYRLAFADDFEAPVLDSRWIPYYLQHWSTPARAAARYALGDSSLVLRIDHDQPPWCPEYDGEVRASLVQTGHFAGPVGSSLGQHRFRDGMVVRSDASPRRGYVPRYGRFELRGRATIGPSHLISLYMLGFEEQPADSGEITIMEIFGTGVGPNGTRLGHGIKPIHDPRLRYEFYDEPLSFDPRDWHTYAAEWTADGVDFFLDGERLHHSSQSPAYAMQFMLGIYELPGRPKSEASEPGSFAIDYFRAWEAGRD